MQNLDIESGVRIIDNIIDGLNSIKFIDEIVLGISEGLDNEAYKLVAEEKGVRFVVGDQTDVLSRIISCGELAGATDIFRVTSESPFLYFERAEACWELHQARGNDATFMEEIIDGCGFEIITMGALKLSHSIGETKHKSELCTLFIRENSSLFKIGRVLPPPLFIRKDLRLTVDYPEDLIVCRAVYKALKLQAPLIPLSEIVKFLDCNPALIALISPFTDAGYSTMYK
jgi:spore coat polysaccharide biosynthesis protein SpsF